MKEWSTKWLAAALAVGLVASLAASGCAEEVGDIDRTQTNRTEKALLAGHWYYLQTVIDAPQTTAQTFNGNTNFGPNARVMFDITEKYLYVVPVVENVEFAEAPYKLKKVRNYWDEGKSSQFEEMYIGQPIAAFPIESHFDIFRQYNQATGKQSNILTEDTTTQLWYKRRYMRVNWGGNAVIDWAFPFGTRQFQPGLDHYVQDGEDQFLKPAGAGGNPDLPEWSADYMSFVTKNYIPPSGTDWQGQACNPFTISNKDCSGTIVKVRHSFKKAPVWSDYETFNYTNREHMDKFGVFLSTRYAYDELWNLTESKRDYKANRWNLWQRTWDTEEILDADGQTIACEKDVDCPTDDRVLDYTANQCKKTDYFKPGTCVKATLIPFRERGLRPILYHMSAGADGNGCLDGQTCLFTNNLESVWYETADEWSSAFKDTVSWLYALEEAGQYWNQACKTDSDCTAGRSDVLADAVIDMPTKMPINPELGYACPADAVAVGNQCMSGEGCDDGNPCDMNQLCDGGVCFWRTDDGAKGDQVLTPATMPGPRAATMVLYTKADGTQGVIPVRDDFFGTEGDPLTSLQLDNTKAAIRFVNATEGSTAKLEGITGDVVFHEGWWQQAYVTAAGQTTLKVTSDQGNAEATVKLEGGFVYIAVYVGGDNLIVAGSKFSTSNTGLRFMHAMPGTGAVDPGLSGVRAAQALTEGQLTDYMRHAFEQERIVALSAGAQGNVTCEYSLHEGRCAGWAGSSEAVDARQIEIKNNMPDMFLICENRYDKAAEATKFADAQDPTRAHVDVHHDGRYSYQGKNPWAAPGSQDLADPNEIFNPCEHFVTKPYALKKAGDIRYSFMYWVGENQASSPLGYGPSGADPETGQMIWGNAYIYGAPLLTYGQWATDIVNMINGNLKVEDVVSGDYIKSYIQAKGESFATDNSGTEYAGALDNMDVLSAKDKAAIFGSHGQFDAAGRVKALLRDPLMDKKELWDFMGNKEFRNNLLRQVPTVSSTYARDRLDKIRGTVIEDMLLNDEVKSAMTGTGMGEPAEMTAELRQQLSPASWATGTAFRSEHATRSKMLARAPCTYDRQFVDDNIFGLAKEHLCTPEEFDQYRNDPASLGGKVCLEGDALRWEMTRRILAGVVEHEVGHTINLRHNFAGSVDLFNFPDEYYKIREKENVLCQANAHCDEDTGEVCDATVACSSASDCPGRLVCTGGVCSDTTGDEWGACSKDNVWVKKFVPRTVMTPAERQAKLSEYQYSTIMDYGGRFNSDIHGLGKYDIAAVKFAYGRLVEVYKDTSKIRNRVLGLAKTFGRDPSFFAYQLETANWRYAGTIFHGFNYLENYIGVEQNLGVNRTTVAYEQIKLERAMNTNYEDNNWNWTRIEVPYRFCSDEFRGNLGCYTWDTGIDIGEIVASALNFLNDYYVLDAFKRERMFYGTAIIGGYYRRVLSRYMVMMGDAARYYAIYDNIFNDYPWYPDHIRNVYGMKVLADAAKTSFNNLAQMVAAPAPGAFMKDDQGVYRNVNYDLNDPQADLTIPLGVGKFPYTQYMNPDVSGFENHVLWVGSFWLKIAALQTLTDSTFYSSSDWVGEQLEIGRSSAVGFNTLYQREMTNLVGGIVSDSFGSYSGVAAFNEATGKTEFKPRDLFNPAADANKDAIEPGLDNLSMKLWAATLGLANLPAGFDPSFTDAMTVFLEGSGAEYDLAAGGTSAGVTKTTFADPFGKKTYVAFRPNYDTERLAPAFAIVKQAADLRAQWDGATGTAKAQLAVQLKQRIQMLDVMRELHTIFGNLVY